MMKKKMKTYPFFYFYVSDLMDIKKNALSSVNPDNNGTQNIDKSELLANFNLSVEKILKEKPHNDKNISNKDAKSQQELGMENEADTSQVQNHKTGEVQNDKKNEDVDDYRAAMKKQHQAPPLSQSTVHTGQSTNFNSQRFQLYLERTHDILKDNILYRSSTTLWKSNKSFDRMEFGKDSVPMYIFSNIKLTCYAYKDSSEIFNTGGIFFPLEQKWSGEKGKITWKGLALAKIQFMLL